MVVSVIMLEISKTIMAMMVMMTGTITVQMLLLLMVIDGEDDWNNNFK